MWYRYYSWSDNPFSIKPDPRLVGLDEHIEELREHLVGGNICLLTGSLGSGKTSTLKATRKMMPRGKRVVYLNAEKLPESFEIERHLKDQRSWFQRLLRQPAKDLILMLDEAHMSSHEFKDELKVLFDEGTIHSMVIAQVKPPFTFSESLKHRVGSRIVKLPPLSEDHAKDLIHIRTDGKHPFEEDTVGIICKHAGFNARRMLEYCELIAHRGSKNEKKRIDSPFVEEVLSNLTTFSDVTPEMPDFSLDVAPSPDAVAAKFKGMEKRIIMVLLEGSRSPKQLSEILSTTQSSIKGHLTKLSERGVVNLVNRKPQVYSLTDQFLGDLVENE